MPEREYSFIMSYFEKRHHRFRSNPIGSGNSRSCLTAVFYAYQKSYIPHSRN